jgi:hypothetical protein
MIEAMPYNVSQELAGDPAKNVQGGRCGAICRPGGECWGGKVQARVRAPAAQLEVVRRLCR